MGPGGWGHHGDQGCRGWTGLETEACPSPQVTGPVAPGPVCNHSLCEGLAPTCRPGHRLLTHFQEDSCCPSYSCGERSLQ